jgi:hypothetical protein
MRLTKSIGCDIITYQNKNHSNRKKEEIMAVDKGGKVILRSLYAESLAVENCRKAFSEINIMPELVGKDAEGHLVVHLNPNSSLICALMSGAVVSWKHPLLDGVSFLSA